MRWLGIYQNFANKYSWILCICHSGFSETFYFAINDSYNNDKLIYKIYKIYKIFKVFWILWCNAQIEYIKNIQTKPKKYYHMLLFKDKPFWFELGIYDIKGLSKTKTKIYFLCMYNSNVSNLIYINIIDMDQRSKHYWKYLKNIYIHEFYPQYWNFL